MHLSVSYRRHGHVLTLMKIALKIIGSIVSILITIILIEHFTGVHIGIADLVSRFMEEFTQVFALFR